MKKEQVFIAVVDNPYSGNVDFEYTVCATKEIAVDCLINVIVETAKHEDKVEYDQVLLDKDEAIKLAKQALEEEDYVECDTRYYRIVEADYLK